jgi:hypothetical protein
MVNKSIFFFFFFFFFIWQRIQGLNVQCSKKNPIDLGKGYSDSEPGQY